MAVGWIILGIVIGVIVAIVFALQIQHLISFFQIYFHSTDLTTQGLNIVDLTNGSS